MTLTNEGTGAQRSAVTDQTRNFTFPALLPGSYTAKVESPGFQTYRKTGNALTANERLSLGNIQLQVGSITETITVAAQGAAVQTASAEGSAVLTTSQMENIAMRGRNVAGFLRLLPGVSAAAAAASALHNVGGVRNTAMTIGDDRYGWHARAGQRLHRRLHHFGEPRCGGQRDYQEWYA